MAHTYIGFSGSVLKVNDNSLMAVTKLLIDRIKKDDKYEMFASAVPLWLRSFEQYGPGVFDIHLDDILSSPALRGSFLCLLEDVKSRLNIYGATIPATVLDTLPPTEIPKVTKDWPPLIVRGMRDTFGNLPVARLQQLIESIENLVKAFEGSAGEAST